jgi:hypothetical protein
MLKIRCAYQNDHAYAQGYAHGNGGGNGHKRPFGDVAYGPGDCFGVGILL